MEIFEPLAMAFTLPGDLFGIWNPRSTEVIAGINVPRTSDGDCVMLVVMLYKRTSLAFESSLVMRCILFDVQYLVIVLASCFFGEK